MDYIVAFFLIVFLGLAALSIVADLIDGKIGFGRRK